MLEPGVYPAAVTPFDVRGRIDLVSVARLFAWFEASCCKGVVLAGTNGEGPSLSAVEKRDLLRDAMPLKGSLELVLGVATPSLDEAHWLCKQASAYGAAAVLLMAPSYFRSATVEGIEDWFIRVLDLSPAPVLIYNFPKMTGFEIEPELMGRLMAHDNAIGLKDSSGNEANLVSYRQATPDSKRLFVGDETLLLKALQSGWTGTISGASNVIPQWLSTIVREWTALESRESAETKFAMVEPVIKAIRSNPQPQTHKRLLNDWRILDCPDPRLPLLAADKDAVAGLALLLKERLGISGSNLGL